MKINLRVISIGVLVATGMIGAVQVAGPESLGISPVSIRWLGIVAAGLAVLQGFLPRVQGLTTDPEKLIEHVSGLHQEDRVRIGDALARRDGMVVLPESEALAMAAEVPPIHPDMTPDQTDQLLTLVRTIGPQRSIVVLGNAAYDSHKDAAAPDGDPLEPPAFLRRPEAR